MNRDVVFEVVADFIGKDVLGLNEGDSLTFDYGLDRTEIMKLIVRLEEKFKIIIPEDDMLEFNTLGDLATYFE